MNDIRQRDLGVGRRVEHNQTRTIPRVEAHSSTPGLSGRQLAHRNDRMRLSGRLQHGRDAQHASIRRSGAQDQE